MVKTVFVGCAQLTLKTVFELRTLNYHTSSLINISGKIWTGLVLANVQT